MATDLAAAAKERGIKYFLISYTDLFGTQRAKLVPTAAIKGMAKSGAGFRSNLETASAGNVSSFGEDKDGELYVVAYGGSVSKIKWK